MKNVHLVIIDPQVDFCCPTTGKLYVKGAENDMSRLAAMIDRLGKKITDIHVTLDSHHPLHIAHPVFWKDRSGNRPAPFTMISATDVEKGVWSPSSPGFYKWVLNYTRTLEKNGRYPLTIWPPHCLIGTVGQTVFPCLGEALNRWCEANYGYIDYVTKGSNILTEHYSAIQADVPDPNDPSTQINVGFLNTVNQADIVLVAGEASSHCVANTVRDACNYFGDDSLVKKLVYLKDGSSRVTVPDPTIDGILAGMESRLP
jgi:nicotinamidase/pyrazinamidase